MSKYVRKMQDRTSLTARYSHLWNSTRPTSENLSQTGNSSDIAALYTLSDVIYEDRKCETTGSICCYGFTEQYFKDKHLARYSHGSARFCYISDGLCPYRRKILFLRTVT